MTSPGLANLRRLRQLVVGVCVLFVVVAPGNSQAPETFSAGLSRHKIALTKAALLDALRDRDKEVRGMAAAELAEMKATDALPEILQAAEVETDAQTQVNLAAAASWMGSMEALMLLRRICRDPTQSPSLRVQAAENVFAKGDHACFEAVAEMLLPSQAADARIGALYLLAQLHDRSVEETTRILQLLVASLYDPEPRMRLEVCQGIRWLKSPGAIAPLRAALAQERDEMVRKAIESALDSLGAPDLDSLALSCLRACGPSTKGWQASNVWRLR